MYGQHPVMEYNQPSSKNSQRLNSFRRNSPERNQIFRIREPLAVEVPVKSNFHNLSELNSPQADIVQRFNNSQNPD